MNNKKLFLVIIIIAILLIVPAYYGGLFENEKKKSEVKEKLQLVFKSPVMLNRSLANPISQQDYPNGAIGYEPSIAVDSTGALYYTAHKDLRWETSWDYLASWFFVSLDNGKTWREPVNWGIGGYGKLWAGDEGDIAVDARDWVYFVDTTLVDNNLHIWSERSSNYQRVQMQGTFLLDDRPWITAQGEGFLHYLGNNGMSVTHPVTGESGRVWYYRSEDAGLTWSTGIPMPGGWATIDCERYGKHVYVAQVLGENIILRSSADMGVTWNEAVIVGPMIENGIGEGMPTVYHGENGTVFVIWQDSPGGGEEPATLYFARSDDYGANFKYWEISPFDAIYLYPTVNVGPSNEVGVAFYGTQDIPVNENSKWYLYADVKFNPRNGTQFDFKKATPQVLYTGNDLHALHDFFEICIAPDGSINIGYQINIGKHPYEDGEEQRYLYFVRGEFMEALENEGG